MFTDGCYCLNPHSKTWMFFVTKRWALLIQANSLIRIQQVLYIDESDVCLGASIRAKWQMVLSVARQEVHQHNSLQKHREHSTC